MRLGMGREVPLHDRRAGGEQPSCQPQGHAHAADVGVASGVGELGACAPPSGICSNENVAAVVVVALVAGAALAVMATALVRFRQASAFGSLVEHAPVGVGYLDRQLRYVWVNDALAAIGDRSIDQLLGRSLDEIYGRLEVTAVARSVLETGKPVTDFTVSGTTSDGHVIHVLAGYYPVRARNGAINGVGVVARDVTARADAERERDELLVQMTRLQAITGALASTTTTDDVVRVVVDDVRRAVGANAAALCAINDGEAEILGAEGYGPEVLAEWAHFQLTDAAAFAEAVVERRLVFADREELEARWPELAASMAPDRQTIAALPLLIGGEAAGVIGFGFDAPRTFTANDHAFLVAVGAQCTDALLRAGLRESSVAAAGRLRFLSEASDALASSLDLDSTLRQVAELAVPRLADIAGVFVVRQNGVVALEIAHANPARADLFRRVADRWRPDLAQAAGIGAVARTGEPLFLTALTDEQVRLGGRDPEHAEALVELSLDSLVAVPMRVQAHVVGLILLATERPRRLSDDDFSLATELAARSAQAILNAELFYERSAVAATLQASLRPPETPVIAGLELAARFFAVGEGIDVGGDFYDVFAMGTAANPTNRWAVVIGDVRGKGLEAASTSGAARHAIRTAALHETSPAGILRQLNEMLLGITEPGDLEPRFCTSVVASVEPNDAGAEVVVATGGHPTPLLLRADGTIEQVGGFGSVIGVLDDPELFDTKIDLHPGDALVLYTDGVTERHAGNRFFDDEGLESVLSRCVGFTAPVLAERIETASRAFVEDAPRDDLAIVVVRVPEGVASTSATSTDLPLDLNAPGLGRRFVVAALTALDAAVEHDIAALLASELVTNAVLHATGPLRVSVESGVGHVRVTVQDGTIVVPRVLDADPEATSGRGMQLVDALALRWGAEPTSSGKSVWFELPA